MDPAAISQAARSGQFAEAASMETENQKAQLTAKLEILQAFLSPEQLARYRQQQMDRIDQALEMMKMFRSKATPGAGN